MTYERASTRNTTLSPQSRYQLQSQSKNSSFSLTLSDTSPLQTVEQLTLPHTVQHIPLYGALQMQMQSAESEQGTAKTPKAKQRSRR
ncbi:hypothetical protein DTO271D3_5968 [Paecilomyces variotii]|nr:hypothetical protein DTO271D3_5968 [Paecilomyces variotii]